MHWCYLCRYDSWAVKRCTVHYDDVQTGTSRARRQVLRCQVPQQGTNDQNRILVLSLCWRHSVMLASDLSQSSAGALHCCINILDRFITRDCLCHQPAADLVPIKVVWWYSWWTSELSPKHRTCDSRLGTVALGKCGCCPLSSNRHLSYVCLEVRGEIIRTVLCCIVYWSCAQ